MGAVSATLPLTGLAAGSRPGATPASEAKPTGGLVLLLVGIAVAGGNL
jgi:hypothetical protein